MRRNSKGFLASALALGLLGAAAASAGQRTAYVVVVDDNLRFAGGSLSGAHNSADRVQHIGCFVDRQFISCIARDSAGLTRSCTTSDAAHVATARAINSTSRVSFTWNVDGTCASLTITNSSIVPPKVQP
jgi:hypothetical protein